MENSWLFFTVKRYAFSVKRQQITPKKISCIDTGRVHSVGFRFSPNTGRLVENLVFLTLRQQTKEIYYYGTPAGFEVNFYLPERRQLIQVSQRLENTSTGEREIRALLVAMKELRTESALTFTDANEKALGIGGIPVKIHSNPEWLVSQEI